MVKTPLPPVKFSRFDESGTQRRLNVTSHNGWGINLFIVPPEEDGTPRAIGLSLKDSRALRDFLVEHVK